MSTPARPLPGWVKVLSTLAGAGALVFAAALAWALPQPLRPLSPTVLARTPDVEHGRYLAVLGDCTACHTKPGGGAFFAGGVSFPTPIGVVYASNITPDRAHGAGAYTLPEFIRLMREGVARDGRRIYPAMPYTEFTKVSDTDLQDLWGYLQQGVPPSAQPSRKSGIPWPLNIRWPLAFWDKLFLQDRRFRLDPERSAQWNRGAYLVQGLTHCGTCHTPRNLAYAEVAETEASPRFLAGYDLAGQSTANLRADAWTGLGRWTPDDIVELLQTARTAHAAVAGQMTEMVVNSGQHMLDGDLAAIAVYLKTLGPAPPTRSGFTPDGATYAAFKAGRPQGAGARMYMDSCSACHRLDGGGYAHAFPTLAGNGTVLHPDPSSLISAVVGGARLPSTAAQPSKLAMPAFGWRYSDAEIAELATFVRSAWGNRAAAVSAGQVKAVRELGVQKAGQE